MLALGVDCYHYYQLSKEVVQFIWRTERAVLSLIDL